MGSRTRDTMKEIDERRARLDATLAELEKRLPGFAWSKRTLGLLVGGGAGGGLLLMALRRARRRKTKGAAPQVTVKVLPGGAVLGAVAIAAIWGAVRVVEAGSRSGYGKPATVTPLPGAAERGA